MFHLDLCLLNFEPCDCVTYLFDSMDMSLSKAPRDGEGQGSLACHSPRGRKESGAPEQQQKCKMWEKHWSVWSGSSGGLSSACLPAMPELLSLKGGGCSHPPGRSSVYRIPAYRKATAAACVWPLR